DVLERQHLSLHRPGELVHARCGPPRQFKSIPAEPLAHHLDVTCPDAGKAAVGLLGEDQGGWPALPDAVRPYPRPPSDERNHPLPLAEELELLVARPLPLRVILVEPNPQARLEVLQLDVVPGAHDLLVRVAFLAALLYPLLARGMLEVALITPPGGPM